MGNNGRKIFVFLMPNLSMIIGVPSHNYEETMACMEETVHTVMRRLNENYHYEKLIGFEDDCFGNLYALHIVTWVENDKIHLTKILFVAR